MVLHSKSKHQPALNRTICLAPMLDRTDRHFRYLLRLISKHTVLFTEMITAHALLRGDRDYLLKFHPSEHPLIFQLGGSDPALLSQCAKIVEDAGYDEINLNIGCPSDRVQKGRFGACLMKEPELVADCVATMQDSVSIPVSVKARLGVDDFDGYDHVADFIATVSATGCSIFYMHARKAWLNGLSPKQNRNVPPLNYEMVTQLATDFPDIEFIINGGITSIDEIQSHLANVNGVMLGRQLYENPFILNTVDRLFYNDQGTQHSRQQILEQYMDYAAQQLEHGVSLHALIRHILGLFHGQPGARHWRRTLTESSRAGHGDINTMRQAMQVFSAERLDIAGAMNRHG
jgi:tRNA-dihydrouridine synthase A